MLHPDLEQLLNLVLPLAKQLLSENGQFFPFGASMNISGTVQMDAALSKEQEFPPSQELIDVLLETLAQRADKANLRAGAVCFNVLATSRETASKTKAICVVLEHQSREAVTAFVPYRKDPSGPMTFENPSFSARKARIFRDI